MQWNSDRNAGFSKAVPAKLYFPVIMDPIWGYQAINVEAQQSDASSLLHWTRNMIALRKIFQVFGRGTQEFLHPANRKVLAYIRDYTGPEGDAGTAGHSETVLCVANLSRFAQPVTLDLSKFSGRQPVEMLGYVPFPPINETPYAITLAPYSFFWLELQPPATRPFEPQAPAAGDSVTDAPGPALPNADQTSFSVQSKLERPDTLSEIEAALPAYIATQRWFGGKSHPIRSTHITSTLSIDDASIIAFVEVTYDSAPPDLYQIPLAIASADRASVLQSEFPNAIISILKTADCPAILFDASASPTFQAALLDKLIHSNTSQTSSDLIATRSSAFHPHRFTDVPSRLGLAEQSNTSILYDELAILKLFRHLRTGENPDVEISRFLTEVAHFPHIPAYLGDLHRSSDGTTIAFLQAFAPNQGDGWAWTLSELDTFYKSVSTCTPPKPSTSPNYLNPAPSPADVLTHASDYLRAAELLGQRTAELHLALASPTIDAAFIPEPYTGRDLAQDRERIDRQSTTALNALQAALQNPSTELPPDVIAMGAELLTYREALLDRAQALTGDPSAFGQRIRIHGDYHLGQLLRTQSKGHADFLIIDFEGEPARPLGERRHKQSPLRDVAGMLRSFSYAAHSALHTATQQNPANADNLALWASAWEHAVGNAFLRGYRSTIGTNPTLLPSAAPVQLPPSTQDSTQPDDDMLQALLLEKAFYELRYELNNRPTWLAIPLSGLLAIARRGL